MLEMLLDMDSGALLFNKLVRPTRVVAVKIEPLDGQSIFVVDGEVCVLFESAGFQADQVAPLKTAVLEVLPHVARIVVPSDIALPLHDPSRLPAEGINV